MDVFIYCIGKLPAHNSIYAVVQDYLRLAKGVRLLEYEVKKKLSPDEMKKQETALLLSVLPPKAYIIALDERGQDLTSVQLAQKMEKTAQTGRPVCFVIGGAFGHDALMREKADMVLRFGAMTLPHFLARAVLAEQIYRIQTILAGHPYHKP